MADLRTSYLGLELKHPIVPSASPLSRELDSLKQLEDAGASAVVLYSLFEEQVSLESGEFSQLFQSGKLSTAEISAYFPQQNEYPRDPLAYVEHVRKAKEALEIPIIASMNGTSKGGWLKYAKMISEAGADGLEINLYILPASDTFMGMDIENLYFDVLKSVKESVDIPVAVKLSPFFRFCLTASINPISMSRAGSWSHASPSAGRRTFCFRCAGSPYFMDRSKHRLP
jgi:dihydroorotate dehydrogenase (fumarate)